MNNPSEITKDSRKKFGYDCLSEKNFEVNLKTGKITVVVYPPWTREVIGSNPIFQTIAPFV